MNHLEDISQNVDFGPKRDKFEPTITPSDGHPRQPTTETNSMNNLHEILMNSY